MTSEYPEFVFVAYEGDTSTQTHEISVSCEAESLVGKPVKYIRHDINTRAVPDVPELETVGHLWECAEYYREEKGWYGYIKLITEESPSHHVSPISKIRSHRELVTRDQAAAIIAAKDGYISEIANHLDCEPDCDSILHTIRENEADKDIYKERAEAAEAKLEHYNGVKGVNTQYSNALANLGMTEDDDPETFADVINDKLEELARHKAARQSYADLFDGDVGSIHENSRNLKAELAQIKAQEPVATVELRALNGRRVKHIYPINMDMVEAGSALYAAPVSDSLKAENERYKQALEKIYGTGNATGMNPQIMVNIASTALKGGCNDKG